MAMEMVIVGGGDGGDGDPAAAIGERSQDELLRQFANIIQHK